LNTKGFSFTGFIDESATPTTCPTGLPVTPNVCYTVPPSQLTGQIGALPPVTITTASTLGVVAPASGNDALVIQLTVFGNAVTAVLELAPGSFSSGILQHPGPFKPSPQALTAASSVPPTINGSSAQYCLGACSSSSETWLGLAGNASSSAPFLSTLFRFTGANGSNPYSSLTSDGAGGYYATTSTGGTSNLGAVFHLTPPVTGSTWTETVIFNFAGNNGANPQAGVFLSSTGALYGTTRVGGVSNLGTVYQLTAPTTGTIWTGTVLHSFAGGTDGSNPEAMVAVDSKGNVYGTTYAGGLGGDGTVFKLAPPSTPGGAWTPSVLHNFTGNDGKNPQAGVLFDSTGALNGTTVNGGANGFGVVFHLAPPAKGTTSWTESVLHSFIGGVTDGANPQSTLVQDSKGDLYGTAYTAGASGMGVAFELTPPTTSGGTWGEVIMHNFAGNDGANPQAGLVMSKTGLLFGTTAKGGLSGSGTIFQLAPSTYAGAWNETVLHSFSGIDGANPQASVVLDSSGLLYSTTVHGGSSAHGTVFRCTP
jgi:uncharacterized repeat protein (TIGR03803 family)